MRPFNPMRPQPFRAIPFASKMLGDPRHGAGPLGSEDWWGASRQTRLEAAPFSFQEVLPRAIATLLWIAWQRCDRGRSRDYSNMTVWGDSPIKSWRSPVLRWTIVEGTSGLPEIGPTDWATTSTPLSRHTPQPEGLRR